MIALHLDCVAFSYVTDPIFADLSWDVHDDRIVGLIGPNGSGKSTLLRLMNGELVTESGYCTRRSGLKIGYLPQEPRMEAGRTVWQEVLSANQELTRVGQQLEELALRLEDPAVYGDEKVLSRALDRQDQLLQQYSAAGGPGYEGRVRSTLHDLGFSDADIELPIDVLSGGQVKLVGMARLLVEGPNMLLLDEPDNHLDLHSKEFLERFLRSFEGGVVIVSHDRYMLDLIVDEIAEIEDGHLTLWPGNYSEYAFEKQLRLSRQQQVFQAQQKEIQRLEDSAKRLITWGQVFDNNKFSRRGQSILKRIEKIERVDRPILERKRMGLEMSGWVGSLKVLEVSGLDKVFPSADGKVERILFAGLNLLVRRGERVGLVGPNGAGKSVLFRIILGQEAASGGEVNLGPSVKTGYYAQNHETLNFEWSVLDTVRLAGNFSEQAAVGYLGRFLFPYRQVGNKIATLSGGERSRLQLALLMLTGANFLLLDEPTNHLDIASAEVLEAALDDFEGSVLVISHDRYFLDRLVSRVVELEDGSMIEYPGNYSDMLASKRHLPSSATIMREEKRLGK